MKIHAKIEDHDKGWGSVMRRAKEAKDGRVKVGVLSGSAGDQAVEGGSLTLGELAVILHFGTDEMKARPWLAMAFDQNREVLTKMGAQLMGKVVLEGMPIDQALGLMGAKLSAEAKKVITLGRQLEPNKQSTIDKKGSDRPLVDTGRLVNANTWVIDRGAK